MTRHHLILRLSVCLLVVISTGTTFCSGEKCETGDEFASCHHPRLLRGPADGILFKIEAVAAELVDYADALLTCLPLPLAAECHPGGCGIQTRSHLQAQFL